jgi:hypothetical protein
MRRHFRTCTALVARVRRSRLFAARSKAASTHGSERSRRVDRGRADSPVPEAFRRLAAYGGEIHGTNDEPAKDGHPPARAAR